MENNWFSAVGKKIFSLIKGKQTSTCLEIHFRDFRLQLRQLKFLVG